MSQDFDNLKKYINDCAKSVDEALEEILPVPDENSELFLLHKAMRYAVLSGGKRFRPFLLIASSDLFGISRVLSTRFACAVELIHCYSLVHDDLPGLDNDDMRRDKPSCHKEFGQGVAILTGDALLTKAFEIASEHTGISSDAQLRIISKLACAASDTGLVGGQFMDIKFTIDDLDSPGLTRMNAMKTGALFAVCCEISVILGNIVSKTTHHHISMYAKSVGAAFQVIDDIYDYESDSKKNNPLNIVSILGYEKAKQEAEMLVNQAIEMLSIFDSKKASVLVEFAKYMYARIK